MRRAAMAGLGAEGTRVAAGAAGGVGKRSSRPFRGAPVKEEAAGKGGAVEPAAARGEKVVGLRGGVATAGGSGLLAAAATTAASLLQRATNSRWRRQRCKPQTTFLRYNCFVAAATQQTPEGRDDNVRSNHHFNNCSSEMDV